MITVVDYGMGNLRSVSKALESLGTKVCVSKEPSDAARAEKLILPGVGAFPSAMRELGARGLIDPIKAFIASGKPYLGICLGLQLLFEESEEGKGAQGMGVLPGKVRRFAVPESAGLKVPHMGWNQIKRQATGDKQQSACPLLNGIADGSFFYFVHSYYADPKDRAVVALQTDYGSPFASMVWRDRLFATQFHPEKSQAVGLQLLKNFVAL
jgi:glutamine amidotransferase